jgi:hypothetical protein
MTSGASPAFQTTVTTTIPLSLSLASQPTGVPLSLSTMADTFSTSGGTGIAGTGGTAGLVQNPEPSTIVLLASGIGTLVWYSRRKHRAG